jgi:ferric-dicitrate binding protein FerR (iron transport regulator)
MNDHREHGVHDSDDDTIRLLRLAGARMPVLPARAARVRTAVHAEWQAGVRRRTTRRRLVFPAVAAAAVAVLVLLSGTWRLADRRMTPPLPGEQVAVVEQLDGSPQRFSNAEGSAAINLSPRDAIRIGDWIETDVHSRLALRFSDGTSVRFDIGSRARPLSSGAIELSAGTVYVDTDRESGLFEVRTEVATARDIGTQFEVRIVDRSVRLRVRTGIVELADRVRSVTGRGGTEITLSAAGAMSRSIALHGPDWDWTASLSPPMEIEGVALADFVARVGRELGLVVGYANPALAQEAAGITLHGSVKGLSPREALDVAVATSGLQHRIEDGSLIVGRGPTTR